MVLGRATQKLKEIGGAVDITRERVRQIREKPVRLLRKSNNGD